MISISTAVGTFLLPVAVCTKHSIYFSAQRVYTVSLCNVRVLKRMYSNFLFSRSKFFPTSLFPRPISSCGPFFTSPPLHGYRIWSLLLSPTLPHLPVGIWRQAIQRTLRHTHSARAQKGFHREEKWVEAAAWCGGKVTGMHFCGNLVIHAVCFLLHIELQCNS